MHAKKELKNLLICLIVCLPNLSYAETTVSCRSAYHDWDALATQQLKAKYKDMQIAECRMLSRTPEIIYEYWFKGQTKCMWLTCPNTKPKPTDCQLNT